LYFADPGSRSDGAIASTIIFFSCGVRSRSCDAGVAGGAVSVAGAALADGWSAGGVVAQAASARLAASNAIALPVVVRKVTAFIVVEEYQQSSPNRNRAADSHFSFGSSALTVSTTPGGVW
jgi:hypothetical protein